MWQNNCQNYLFYETLDLLELIPLSNNETVFLSVLGVFYLLYLPAVVDSFFTYSTQYYVVNITKVLLAFNGIASPLIYVWQSETFRHNIAVMYGLKAPETPGRRNDISLQS